MVSCYDVKYNKNRAGLNTECIKPNSRIREISGKGGAFVMTAETMQRVPEVDMIMKGVSTGFRNHNRSPWKR